MTVSSDNLWTGAYKIPWDDPEFSRRMLAEHLAQGHDLASRRVEWIDRQVEWIHNNVLTGEPATILDLGCGPGFYAHRLTAFGHRIVGVDFGPASIEHARRLNPHPSRCRFIHADIRGAAFKGPYDLAMLLYGEFNVFSPDETALILRNMHACLEPHGQALIEAQTPETVEALGRGEPSEQRNDAGLFSDRPHVCRTDSQWLPEQHVALQTFTITDAETGRRQVYRSTTRAWSDQDLAAALQDAGFGRVSRCIEWPCNTDSLALWIARR